VTQSSSIAASAKSHSIKFATIASYSAIPISAVPLLRDNVDTLSINIVSIDGSITRRIKIVFFVRELGTLFELMIS